MAVWFAVGAAVVAACSMGLALWLWRRQARLEARLAGRAGKAPYTFEREAQVSLELSLEAILEELEQRGQEVLKKIEQHERDLRVLAAGASGAAPRAHPPDPPGGRREPGRAAARSEAGEAAPAPHAAGPAHPNANPKRDAVQQLAAQGLDASAIAQRLGLGKGEVQLILELHRQQA